MQHDFILLDRSGSMSSLWNEALSSVNAYAKKLAEDKIDTGITVAVFDLHNGLDFKVVRDKIEPANWTDLTDKDASPRGSTPLNDATGRIVGLANSGGYDKVAIIIMTDGHENASTELTVDQAKKLLDDCRAKNWQVIFLGANFDNAAQAKGYGNAKDMTISASAVHLSVAMGATSELRKRYAATGDSMKYTDEQKKRFAK